MSYLVLIGSRKSSQYIRQNSDVWVPLSAQDYLVFPDQRIAPYNITSKSTGKETQRNKAVQVWTMLKPSHTTRGKDVSLAGVIHGDKLIE
jgi:hypothetical protein